MSQDKEPDVESHIWVRSDVMPDGSYRATIEFTPDESVTLNDEQAIKYAMAVLGAAHIAEYEAAILAQFKAAGVPEVAAAQYIAEKFRTLRTVPDTGTQLSLVPGISKLTKDAFLIVMLHGKESGQWDFNEARDHAQAVLDVIIAARLDQIYFLSLTKKMEMDDDLARRMVGGIGKFRPSLTTDT